MTIDIRTHRGFAILPIAALCLLTPVPAAYAQKLLNTPPTDSAAQSSPLKPTPKVAPTDAATQASPIIEPPRHDIWLAPHTAIPIVLNEKIDSGTLKNGQNLVGKLSAPLQSHGETLPAGSPVAIDVVATVPAGKLTAEGEFSLQVTSVGHLTVYTDTLTFRGQPGHRDVADAAPAVGTDAGLPSGAPLTFHVLPPPSDDVSVVQDPANMPGSVNGVASGGPPPQGSVPARPSIPNDPNSTGSGNQSNGNQGQQNQPSVVPANTTSHPIQGATPTQPR